MKPNTKLLLHAVNYLFGFSLWLGIGYWGYLHFFKIFTVFWLFIGWMPVLCLTACLESRINEVEVKND